MLTNKVADSDFLSTSVLLLDKETVGSISDEIRDGYVADNRILTISVSRESTPEEVKQSFNFIKKYYFKNLPTPKGDQIGGILSNDGVTRAKHKGTVSNIMRDREWYWMNKGIGYHKIHKLNPGGVYSWAGVRVAINRYRENLLS
jgi:hypothetical protein